MITYKCKINIENINQSKIPIEEAESGDVGHASNKVFELPFDEVVGVVDCQAGKAGSGNGGKAGTAGMSLVFAFFLGDCLLGITEESRSSSESSSSLSCRNLRFGLNENLMMCKSDANE